MTTAIMSDYRVAGDVLEELKWDPSVDATHIGVSVKDAVVTLSGHVSSYAEKYAAERAAKRVHGVRAVANDMDVRLPGEQKRTDEDIAAATIRAEGPHSRPGRQNQSHRQHWLGAAGSLALVITVIAWPGLVFRNAG